MLSDDQEASEGKNIQEKPMSEFALTNKVFKNIHTGSRQPSYAESCIAPLSS